MGHDDPTTLDDIGGTEADAVARIVREADTTPIDGGTGWFALAVAPGWRVETIDVARHLPEPARPRGTVTVYDAASFLAALRQRVLDRRPPVAYADEGRLTLVGVLDDDHADLAGWRQYRVELALRRTPEWTAWREHDESPMGQEAFSYFVEEHAREFRVPAAADMLELASTIEGTKTAQFKAGVRLKDGARQVGWAETIDARAGQTGQLIIPDRFLIAMRPFVGAAPFEVEAWLRFRIADGHLKLSYKLDRPDLIDKAVFDDVVVEVATALDAPTVVRGPAPAVS